MVATPAGSTPQPDQPYQFADQLSPGTRPGARPADHDRPEQGRGRRRGLRRGHRPSARGPADPRQDPAPAEGDPQALRAVKLRAQNAAIEAYVTGDGFDSQFGGILDSSVNDAQSASVYSDVVVHTLKSAMGALHVVSERLAARTGRSKPGRSRPRCVPSCRQTRPAPTPRRRRSASSRLSAR